MIIESLSKMAENQESDQINEHNSLLNKENSLNGLMNNSITDVARELNLQSTEAIPEEFRNVFPHFKYFNKIQSSVFDGVFNSDDPFVISAPTGSGKTVLFELAIIRLLLTLKNSYNQDFKIVYIAPMKALCEERLSEWHHKFNKHGLNCISVTGDSDYIDFQNLMSHKLIITTPEKWDCLTRKWKDNKKFVELVKLFMIDEVHLLNEEARGPTLEAIVVRMKTIQDALSHQSSTPEFRRIRFIALSATVPNIEDLAEWLSSKELKANCYKFGEESRPVSLKKIVYGYLYNPQSNPFKFDLALNYKLQSIILQHSHGKPTLIFCSTRKSAEMTSKFVAQNITINLNMNQQQILIQAADSIKDAAVKDILIHGIGYHHAGLESENRRTIENLFRNGHLPILVTTSTLAMGVNLPAHLVIIKSTKYYGKGGYCDYTESTLLQMIGRAGRPQFDTTATAIIMTTMADKKKYENLLGGEQPIESSLHRHLTEHLNAEVVLGTITDLTVALEWVTSTFLRIRARKNPRHYGIPTGLTPDQIDKKLLEMCQIEINKLAKYGMLALNSEEGLTITPTTVGQLMAKYLIAFASMKLFLQMSGNEHLQQLLCIISKCQEFSEIYLRVNDKKSLNLLNKCRHRETIRFPLNGKIKSIDMKVNCLIQAMFGCLPILESSLNTETQKIMRTGERVSKCLVEYLESKPNCYSALSNSLILAKCFQVRLWENSPYLCKQFSRIGAVLTSNLVMAGKKTFQDILDTNPRDIERILKRKPPLGNEIQEKVKNLPKYTVKLELVENISKQIVVVEIKMTNSKDIASNMTCLAKSIMTLIVGDDNNTILIYKKYSHSSFLENPTVELKLETIDKDANKIFVQFISEDWVGFDVKTFLKLKDSKDKENKESKSEISSGTKRKDVAKNQSLISKYLSQNTPNPKAKVGDNSSGNNTIHLEEKKNINSTLASASNDLLKRHSDKQNNDKSSLNQQLTIDKFYSVKKTTTKKRKLYDPDSEPVGLPVVDELDQYRRRVSENKKNIEEAKIYPQKEPVNSSGSSNYAVEEDITPKLDQANEETIQNPYSSKERCLVNSGTKSILTTEAENDIANSLESNKSTLEIEVDDYNKFQNMKKQVEESILKYLEARQNVPQSDSKVSKNKKDRREVLLERNRAVLKELSSLQDKINGKQEAPKKIRSQRKRYNLQESAIELEKSLTYNEKKKPIDFDQFRMQCPNKFKHDVNQELNDDGLYSEAKKKSQDTNRSTDRKSKFDTNFPKYFDGQDSDKENSSSGNLKKTITWRSPLVVSTTQKYSPNIQKSNKLINEIDEALNTSKTTEVSMASRASSDDYVFLKKPIDKLMSQFPLTDKACSTDISDSKKSKNKEADDLGSSLFKVFESWKTQNSKRNSTGFDYHSLLESKEVEDNIELNNIVGQFEHSEPHYVMKKKAQNKLQYNNKTLQSNYRAEQFNDSQNRNTNENTSSSAKTDVAEENIDNLLRMVQQDLNSSVVQKDFCQTSFDLSNLSSEENDTNLNFASASKQLKNSQNSNQNQSEYLKQGAFSVQNTTNEYKDIGYSTQKQNDYLISKGFTFPNNENQQIEYQDINGLQQENKDQNANEKFVSKWQPFLHSDHPKNGSNHTGYGQGVKNSVLLPQYSQKEPNLFAVPTLKDRVRLNNNIQSNYESYTNSQCYEDLPFTATSRNFLEEKKNIYHENDFDDQPFVLSQQIPNLPTAKSSSLFDKNRLRKRIEDTPRFALRDKVLREEVQNYQQLYSQRSLDRENFLRFEATTGESMNIPCPNYSVYPEQHLEEESARRNYSNIYQHSCRTSNGLREPEKNMWNRPQMFQCDEPLNFDFDDEISKQCNASPLKTPYYPDETLAQVQNTYGLTKQNCDDFSYYTSQPSVIGIQKSPQFRRATDDTLNLDLNYDLENKENVYSDPNIQNAMFSPSTQLNQNQSMVNMQRNERTVVPTAPNFGQTDQTFMPKMMEQSYALGYRQTQNFPYETQNPLGKMREFNSLYNLSKTPRTALTCTQNSQFSDFVKPYEPVFEPQRLASQRDLIQTPYQHSKYLMTPINTQRYNAVYGQNFENPNYFDMDQNRIQERNMQALPFKNYNYCDNAQWPAIRTNVNRHSLPSTSRQSFGRKLSNNSMVEWEGQYGTPTVLRQGAPETVNPHQMAFDDCDKQYVLGRYFQSVEHNRRDI